MTRLDGTVVVVDFVVDVVDIVVVVNVVVVVAPDPITFCCG